MSPTPVSSIKLSATGVKFELPKEPNKLKARWLPAIQDLTPHEQGFAKGYHDGRMKAEADCKKEMEERIQESRNHWNAIAKALNNVPRSMIQKLRDDMITMAFEAIRKILAATPVTREEVGAQIEQMLEHAETGSEINVQLNPTDLELLTEQDRASLWNEDFTHLKWSSNPAVPRGGCVLQGEFGWIDGRRETRLKKFEQLAKSSIKDS
jgi:flagellar assembly protein FliH